MVDYTVDVSVRLRHPKDVRPKRGDPVETYAFKQDLNDRIECLWLAGASYKEFKRLLGVHRYTIEKVCADRGLPERMTGRHALNVFPCIVAWAKAGFTEEEIKNGLRFTGKRKVNRR